eukprot:COSAG04_NODE_30586_length_261_cov_2.203704_1_plen_49_part_01
MRQGWGGRWQYWRIEQCGQEKRSRTNLERAQVHSAARAARQIARHALSA